MKNNKDRERINVTFTIDTYNQIKLVADKRGKSMSELVREWSMEGLNGTLTQNNLDVLAPIIREQLSSVLNPAVERLSSLSAKACIQAGAAAYLSAEAILKFVPDEEKEEVAKTYEAARKKSVQYMRGRADLD
jgi:hypothetical protein